MIEQDTVKLLRECDAGIKMGTSSIDDVVGRVKSRRMKNSLEAIRGEHSRLEDECSRLLNLSKDIDNRDVFSVLEAVIVFSVSSEFRDFVELLYFHVDLLYSVDISISLRYHTDR